MAVPLHPVQVRLQVQRGGKAARQDISAEQRNSAERSTPVAGKTVQSAHLQRRLTCTELLQASDRPAAARIAR